MKTLRLVVLVIAFALSPLFAGEAISVSEGVIQQRMRAGTPAIAFPGLGSYELALSKYAVPRSKFFALGVYQETDNGYINVKKPLRANISFSSKEELDIYFHQKLVSLAEGALTNSMVDPNKPIMFLADTTYWYETIGWVYYMYSFGSFYLVKSSDGSYSLPDLSGFKLDLAEGMVYELPDADEVRVEVHHNPATTGRTGIVHVSDSRYLPTGTSEISFSMEPGAQFVNISNEYAQSGTNGPTLLKISVLLTNGMELVFGPMGTQTPLISNMKMVGSEMEFDVTGERGKVVRIDSSTELGGEWTPVGHVTIPTSEAGIHFRSPLSGPQGFFRVVTE